jgi:hypothetical protein
MKHVTFTQDMRPYRIGDMRLVPDEIAAKLEAEGAIKPNPPTWPEGAAGDEPVAPRRRVRPPLNS